MSPHQPKPDGRPVGKPPQGGSGTAPANPGDGWSPTLVALAKARAQGVSIAIHWLASNDNKAAAYDLRVAWEHGDLHLREVTL